MAKPSSSNSILLTVVNFAVFLLICWVATLYHVYCSVKKLRPRSSIAEVADDQRIVVITGCDHGFGRLLVDALYGSTKFHIVALTLTEEASTEIAESKGHDARVQAIKCDVTSDTDVAAMKKMVHAMCDDCETSLKLYAIVNNAGIAIGSGHALFFETPEKHMKVMDVNYFGMLRVTCALQELLVHAKSNGRIVNLSSVCGATATPGNSAYNASKFAVEAWSDSLRIELAPFGVHVVKVRPGQTSTAIQEAWASNCIANFEAAPDSVQRLYGGKAWLESLQKAFGSGGAMSNSSMTTPEVVVEILREILVIPEPKASYWTGNDAKTMFKALYSLPSPIVESAKLLIGSLMNPVTPKEEDKVKSE
jgi:NAD(P)-dependent dehydrogenase (short-subunit alcohol dehydrogenase family)